MSTMYVQHAQLSLETATKKKLFEKCPGWRHFKWATILAIIVFWVCTTNTKYNPVLYITH